jgi:hypothetical protein
MEGSGIQLIKDAFFIDWIPAFAGMTVERNDGKIL